MSIRFKRGSKKRQQRQLRVGMDIAEMLKELEKPHPLKKIRGPKERFERKYYLDPDHKAIWYEGSMKKNKKQCCYYISEIKDVREGFESEVFQRCKKTDLQEDHAFSIIYSDKYFSLDLIASSSEERVIWVKGLRHLTKRMNSSLSLDDIQKEWVRDWFRRADLNGDKLLSRSEIENVLKEMNATFDPRAIKNFFNAVAVERKLKKGDKKALDEEGFEEFYKMIGLRKDLLQIIMQLTDDKQVFDLDTFKYFLTNHQRMEGVTDETCIAIIEKHEVCEEFRKRHMLTVEGLRAFLLHSSNNLFNPAHNAVYQDMNQPLSHYFINSSHNTYLLEDQMVGRGTAEAYFHALDIGCRCVEADCHDGDNGKPIVYHKYTLVDKVLFEDVIRSVKQHALKTSKYPLILSLEVSCSVEQQDRMAEILKELLGDLIFTKSISEDAERLPSPEELKGKVLIRGSKLRSHKIVKEASIDEDENKENQENAENKENRERKASEHPKISKQLSDLVTAFQKVTFVNFEHFRENYKCYQGTSMVEAYAEVLAKEQGAEFIKHNLKYMTRVYPDGVRFASSNYDPMPLWNVGCQIVALNVQTRGEELQMLHARFMDNGGCGYVLKPSFLRDPNSCFDPYNVTRRPIELRLRIISGQQLMNNSTRDILDPFVRVRICGVPIDNAEQKTGVVDNNGFNPIWNQTFTFQIHVPELAIVHFLVRDHDAHSSNDTIAQFALPFTSMQQGYRHVYLQNKLCQPLPMSSLFVYCEIDNDPSP